MKISFITSLFNTLRNLFMATEELTEAAHGFAKYANESASGFLDDARTERAIEHAKRKRELEALENKSDADDKSE